MKDAPGGSVHGERANFTGLNLQNLQKFAKFANFANPNALRDLDQPRIRLVARNMKGGTGQTPPPSSCNLLVLWYGGIPESSEYFLRSSFRGLLGS